ncbi:hypothetical protein [uncultured Psychroserpens sp.]|uniref:hypothetical protein n=1 Tax=uncultured Psychroserpens sp. TaxID=255436 RepID=UPI0026098142|nr:hypothetical protein [uncultured Psychroserpens sp.]
MNKTIIAIFFSILFVSLIAAPTIIIAIDDTADVSYFYSTTEEEENKSDEKNKEIDVLLSESNTGLESWFILNTDNHMAYRFKNYPKPHLNLISPPPEFIS